MRALPVRFPGAALAAAWLGLAACSGASGGPAKMPQVPAGAAEATFAGGCFWCMEGPFDKLPGVFSTTSGYSGGSKDSPTYEEVGGGGTGHAEAIHVVYDPEKISYAQLLDVFWRNIDPFSKGGQFCDRGSQYRSAIFVQNDAERKAAEDSKQALEARFGKPIETEIVKASKFYAAEEYHQDFYKKDPGRYHSYREGCGRDRRLHEVWGEEAGGMTMTRKP